MQSAISKQYLLTYATGFFQISNPSRPTNLIPAFVNITTWVQDYCVAQFGRKVAAGPDIDKTNNKYHGWHIQASNVFYVNGQYDPWRALSVASDVDKTSPGNILTTKTPAANSLLANNTKFGYVVQNGLHCSDLSYNMTAVQAHETIKGGFDESANEAHELFASALEVWLPAFKNSAAGTKAVGYNGTGKAASVVYTGGSGPTNVSFWSSILGLGALLIGVTVLA
jgi:hypothetical protein